MENIRNCLKIWSSLTLMELSVYRLLFFFSPKDKNPGAREMAQG